MQVTDAMVEAAMTSFSKNPLSRESPDAIRAALTAALAEIWRPAESDSAGLLYFPKKVTGHHRQSSLPEMMKVGRVSDFPNRLPTHFMPLPPPPMGK